MTVERDKKVAEIFFKGHPVIYIKKGGDFTTKDKKGSEKIVHRANFIPVRYTFLEWLDGISITMDIPIYNKNKEYLRTDQKTLTLKSIIKKATEHLKGKTIKERVIIRGKIKYKKKKLQGILDRISNIHDLSKELNKIYYDSNTNTPIFTVKFY